MTTIKNNPEDFDRRILLAVSGGSPAILTETLYALAKERKPPYLPTEIHIITTTKGRQSLQPLLGDNSKIRALAQDYDLTLPDIPESNIHVITDSDEQALSDITTADDNESAANRITAKVWELTSDNTASLYVSIAGGRKTMSYYLGYAMSVFGRIQDRMSHVLVDDKYMSKDFYYPTPQQQVCMSFSGEPFNAHQVSVKLGELPFIRLRDGLTNDLLEYKDTSFSEIIKIAQRQLRPIKVELRHTPERKKKPWQLLCSGSEITGLNNAELAIYAWLLLRHKMPYENKLHFNRRPNNEKLARDFLSVYKKLFGEGSGGFSKAYRALIEDDDGRQKEGITGKYFFPKKSVINQSLEKSLSLSGASSYSIIEIPDDGFTYIALPPNLQADDIQLPTLLYDTTDTSS